MKSIRCKRIVGGAGQGMAIVTRQPINFLAMVDTKTGKIKDSKHELYDRSIKGRVLVFPYAIGSSVGAYSIYSLKENGVAPSAIVCSKADITTASGSAIANIPVVQVPEKDFPSEELYVRVEADRQRVTFAKESKTV